jgi:type IV secretory pathway VirB10-like protein
MYNSHAPLNMNEKKHFSVSKFLKRAAIVTLILAAIEIPFIYFYFNKNEQPAEKAEVVSSQTEPHTEQTLIKDLQPPTERIVVTDSQVNVTPIDTVKVQAIVSEPMVKKETPVEKKLDTIKPQAKKEVISEKKLVSEKAVATEKIDLSVEVMNKAVERLNAQREKAGHVSKCVKIRQTASSNVNNGFKIAEQLRANGYIISGRETIQGVVKGITVQANKDCMVVTVGSL